MATDPVERIEAMLGEVVERMETYSRMALSAAERNARGEYRADDLLADLQAAWQLAVQDMATATANIIDVVARPADGEPDQ